MHSGQNWLLKYGNFFFFKIFLFSLCNGEVKKPCILILVEVTILIMPQRIVNLTKIKIKNNVSRKITKTLKSYRRFWKTFFPAVLVISAFLIENKMIKINKAPQFSSCIDVDSYSCWLIFFFKWIWKVTNISDTQNYFSMEFGK